MKLKDFRKLLPPHITFRVGDFETMSTVPMRFYCRDHRKFFTCSRAVVNNGIKLGKWHGCADCSLNHRVYKSEGYYHTLRLRRIKNIAIASGNPNNSLITLVDASALMGAQRQTETRAKPQAFCLIHGWIPLAHKIHKKLTSCVACRKMEDRQKAIANSKFALYDLYAHQLTIEEDPHRTKSGVLRARCTYCKNLFKPTRAQVQRRIYALEGTGKVKGEQRLYCSAECKSLCSVYGMPSNWSFNPQHRMKKRERIDLPESLKRRILERDQYRCQRCYDTQALELHHVIPISRNPMLAEDPDNIITLCKEHHAEAHNQPGCDYQSLAKDTCAPDYLRKLKN